MKPSAILRTLLITWALIAFGNAVSFLTGGLNTFDHAVYAMLGALCMAVMVYGGSWLEAQREPLPWEDSIPPDAPAPENEVRGKKKTFYMLPPEDVIRHGPPPSGTFSGESWAATSNGRAAVIAASRADPDLEAQPYIVRPWFEPPRPVIATAENSTLISRTAIDDAAFENGVTLTVNGGPVSLDGYGNIKAPLGTGKHSETL